MRNYIWGKRRRKRLLLGPDN